MCMKLALAWNWEVRRNTQPLLCRGKVVLAKLEMSCVLLKLLHIEDRCCYFLYQLYSHTSVVPSTYRQLHRRFIKITVSKRNSNGRAAAMA